MWTINNINMLHKRIKDRKHQRMASVLQAVNSAAEQFTRLAGLLMP